MANLLKMAMIETILSLHRAGWSNRRIARELGVDRDAVSRHIRRRPIQKPPNASRLRTKPKRFKSRQSASRLGRGCGGVKSRQSAPRLGTILQPALRGGVAVFAKRGSR